MANQPPPVPTPFLCEDVLRNILVRLPPDEPEMLIRAAAVCKPWLRILCDPGFRQRYRAHHQPPPVMGFLLNLREEKDVARLEPCTRYTPLFSDHEDLDVLDARHGRVLLHAFFSDASDPAFVIWDPATDDHRHAEPPRQADYDSWTVTLMCGEADCDHILCTGSDATTLVFLCSSTLAGVTSAYRYNSDTSIWSEPSTTASAICVDTSPAVMNDGKLYFTSRRDSLGRFVEYVLEEPQINLISPPTLGQAGPCKDYILLPGAGKRLRLVTIQLSMVMVWDAEVPPNGAGVAWGWEAQNTINLSRPMRLLENSPGTVAIGFCEDHQLLYFASGEGFYSVHLMSGLVTKVKTIGSFYSVIPFVSSITADIAHARLGRYT